MQIKSRKIRWVGHVDIGERTVYRVSMRKPEGKRPVVRPSCGWDDGISTDLR
jgi:hypothetical protein